MNNKHSLKKHWKIAGIAAVGLAIFVFGAFWLRAQIYFDPSWARSLGLLGPLTEETEEPRLMEGYIFINFEVINFEFCEYAQEHSLGNHSLGGNVQEVMSLMESMADLDGSSTTNGYTVYARFIGRLARLKNAGNLEGFGPNGMYKSEVRIIELLELQPQQDQCAK
jgi:hypothetical protein